MGTSTSLSRRPSLVCSEAMWRCGFRVFHSCHDREWSRSASFHHPAGPATQMGRSLAAERRRKSGWAAVFVSSLRVHFEKRRPECKTLSEGQVLRALDLRLSPSCTQPTDLAGFINRAAINFEVPRHALRACEAQMPRAGRVRGHDA